MYSRMYDSVCSVIYLFPHYAFPPISFAPYVVCAQGTAEQPGLIERTLVMMFQLPGIRQQQFGEGGAQQQQPRGAGAVATGAMQDQPQQQQQQQQGQGQGGARLALSYFEVYNELFFDLLDPQPPAQRQPLKLREDSRGNTCVPGLLEVGDGGRAAHHAEAP